MKKIIFQIAMCFTFSAISQTSITAGSKGLTGSLTANYIPVAVSSKSLTNSVISQSGFNILIPPFTFNSNGSISTSLFKLKIGNDVGSYGSGGDNYSFGYYNLHNLSVGTGNVAFGDASGGNCTSCSYNSFYGGGTGLNTTNGSFSSYFGHNAGKNNNGNYSVLIGESAGFSSTGSDDCVNVGSYSGYYNNGNRNVFLGNAAGFNRLTDSDMLFIDNRNRGSAANDLSNSLIVGSFNAVPSNQTLNINAVLAVTQTPIYNSSLPSGTIFKYADVSSPSGFSIGIMP